MNETIQGYATPAILLSDVQEEHAFNSHDGVQLRSYAELAHHLVTMSDDAYTHHVSTGRNDFHNWVRDVHGDHHLAQKLKESGTRGEMHHHVMGRIHQLNAIDEKNKVHERLAKVRHNMPEYLVGAFVGLVVGLLIGAI